MPATLKQIHLRVARAPDKSTGGALIIIYHNNIINIILYSNMIHDTYSI